MPRRRGKIKVRMIRIRGICRGTKLLHPEISRVASELHHHHRRPKINKTKMKSNQPLFSWHLEQIHTLFLVFQSRNNLFVSQSLRSGSQMGDMGEWEFILGPISTIQQVQKHYHVLKSHVWNRFQLLNGS